MTRGFLSAVAVTVAALGLPSAAAAQACLGLHATRPVPTAEVISTFQRDGITGPSSLGLSLTAGRLFASVETGADLSTGESALAARNGIAGSLGLSARLGPITSCVGGAMARSETIGATTTGATAAFGGAAIRLPSLPGLPMSAFGVASYERRTTESAGLDDLTSTGMVYRVGLASYPFPWLGLRVYEDRFDDERRTGFSVGITLPLGAKAPEVVAPQAPEVVVPQTPEVVVPQTPEVVVPQTPEVVVPQTPEVVVPKAAEVVIPADADADGVIDAQDECRNTPAGAEVDARGCPKLFAAAASFTLTGVTFETSSAVIQPISFEKLDEVAEALQANPEVRVEISGHTDDVGSDESNQRLSQARAESVRAYLIEKGVAADRLEARGFGESRPVASNETPEGRAENRRVEMRRLP